MTVPPHHFEDEPDASQPGGLLGELERRQEDVLNQLDDLDSKLSEVLEGLEPGLAPALNDSIDSECSDQFTGASADQHSDEANFVDESFDEEPFDEEPLNEEPGSAEDWA